MLNTFDNFLNNFVSWNVEYLCMSLELNQKTKIEFNYVAFHDSVVRKGFYK